MKKQTISFNNFKSFGEKMQTFSRKPLTLVYGPNSVGKSSLLHLLVLIEYYKNTGNTLFEKREIDAYTRIANFAGDNLDLGGFGDFIHRKDKKRQITYQETFYGKSNIDSFWGDFLSPIRKFEDEGVFSQDITASQLCERIKLYQRKDDSSLVLFGKQAFVFYNRNFLGKNYDKELSQEVELTDALNPGVLPELEHDKIIFVIREIENGYDLEKNLKRSDQNIFDKLDKLIIYILNEIDEDFLILDVKGIVEKCLNHISAYKRFLRIDSIGFLHKLGLESIETKILINRECFIQMNNRAKGFVINKAHFLIDPNGSDLAGDANVFARQLNGLNSTPLHLFQNAMSNVTNSIDPRRILFRPNFFAEQLIYNYTKSINLRTQYFGPLRYYPSRLDMTLADDSRTKWGYGKPVADFEYDEMARKLLKISINRQHSFIATAVGGIVGLATIFSYISTRISILFSADFRRLMKSNLRQSSVDLKNRFRKSKNILSLSGSINSEQVWLQLINSEDIQFEVNRWLSETSKLDSKYAVSVQEFTKHGFFRKLFRQSPKKYRKLTFVDSRTNTKVTPREMGLGISQFLPILVAARVLNSYRILIEQPELHLHPSAQCEIADEFIRSYHAQNNEFVIETHSEHLLLRIMKRMRETADGTLSKDDPLAITPEDICLLYVDSNGESTYLNELELDEDGTLLDPWPNGFFEEGYRERFN